MLVGICDDEAVIRDDLLKPVKEQEFMQTLTEAVKEITRNYKAIVGIDGETNYIKLQDIIYVEYMNQYSF